jgi:hypothetical protein
MQYKYASRASSCATMNPGAGVRRHELGGMVLWPQFGPAVSTAAMCKSLRAWGCMRSAELTRFKEIQTFRMETVVVLTFVSFVVLLSFKSCSLSTIYSVHISLANYTTPQMGTLITPLYTVPITICPATHSSNPKFSTSHPSPTSPRNA